MTITLQMPPRLEARLRDEAAREGVDAGTLVLRALERQFGSAVSSTPSTCESELLLRISEGPSQSIWQRYRELSAKRDAQILTPGEQEELIGLSETIEAADVERLKHMVELARLRGVDLPTVRMQLGIPGPDFSDGHANV